MSAMMTAPKMRSPTPLKSSRSCRATATTPKEKIASQPGTPTSRYTTAIGPSSVLPKVKRPMSPHTT